MTYENNLKIDKFEETPLDVRVIIPDEIEEFLKEEVLPFLPSTYEIRHLFEHIEESLLYDLRTENKDRWLDENSLRVDNASFYAYEVSFDPSGEDEKSLRLENLPEKFKSVDGKDIGRICSDLGINFGYHLITYVCDRFFEKD